MKLEKKKKIVENLTENLAKAEAFILADYQGLDTAKISRLRKDLRATGGAFLIAKNTLIRRALSELKLPKLRLAGPTAVVFCPKKPLEAIKTLFRFIQKEKLPKIKLGFFEGLRLSSEQVFELSKLGGREALLSRLLGDLRAPLLRLTFSLGSPQRRLLIALVKITKKKDAN